MQQSIPELFVLEALEKKSFSILAIQKLKNKYSSKFAIPALLNLDLIKAYRDLLDEGKIEAHPQFFALIQKRSIRTLSGIAPLSIFTKDFGCPGECVFCPTEKNMPKSYLSTEPGMMRAVLNQFDPYKQVHNRLRAFEVTGHNTDKIELIVQGGTFSSYPKHYQVSFLKGAFNAMNSFSIAKEKLELEERSKFKYAKFGPIDKKRLNLSSTLKDAHKLNETADVRCVGLTLETRPDWINKKELKRLRWLGATRLEIGVQHTHNDVLMKNKRGHLAGHVIRATKLMKDAGFKFTYHMMPGLWGTTFEKDVDMFRDILTKQEYQPDQLKFYPCVVTEYSELTKLWRSGEFKPMEDEDFLKLSMEVLPMIPEHMRLIRFIRDIPATDILAGTKTSNLRQVAEAQLKKEGKVCRDIRAREVRDQVVVLEDVEMIVREYDASDGKEYFISFEDTRQDLILSFLRLRIPSQYFEKKKHWMKVLQGAALIREIHTYGAQLQIGGTGESAQHQGFGRRMIEKAEEIVREKYSDRLFKMAVISGIGVREYFRKWGYELEGEYMIKRIKDKG